MNIFYLTKLIKSYYNLPKGYIIDNPNFLNFVCKIFDICDVYISNKALKHIVESRKDKDFMTVDEIIDLVKGFTVVLLDPDVVFINEERINSIGLVKKFRTDEPYSLVVILEYNSIYFNYELVTLFERHDKKIKHYLNIKHLIK